MDLSTIAPGLSRGADGIWHAATRAAVDYPDHGNDFCFAVEAESFWFNYRNRFIVEAVRQHPPAGPIVDIGAGNGYVALALERAGWRTIAMEPGASGARNARSRGLETVVCATLQDARFQPHSLDAAGLFDVLEHIGDSQQFLHDLERVLKPGGRLYLTVPAFRVLWSAEDDIAGHHERYTIGRLSARLRGSGFEIDYATYLFSPLPLPLFLFRTIPSRLRRRRGFDPAQNAAELRPSPGLAVRMVTTVLDGEVSLIKRGWRVPFGTSCLVAAHKVGIRD